MTLMSRKNSVGDGVSATQKHTLGALTDTVRDTKKSSTPVTSDTTSEKGATDKKKATRVIVQLSQDVLNKFQGLGPNICVGICYSLDVQI